MARARSYSAKAAAAGKDIGKPNNSTNAGFNTVAAKAAKEYGSAAAGKRVAGAVLKNLRAKGK